MSQDGAAKPPPPPPPARAPDRAGLAPGEAILLDLLPSRWMIVLHRIIWAYMLLACLGLSLLPIDPIARPVGVLQRVLAAGAAGIVLYNVVDRLTRRYLLTDRRILRESGVFQRVLVEVPLVNLQSVTLLRSVRERVTALGTLGVSSAAGGLEFTWYMIPRPDDALAAVRSAADSARSRAAEGHAP